MGLIRFGQADGRGPSAELWAGVPDWMAGNSHDPQFGSKDYEDFSPYLGADVGMSTTGDAVAERDSANGVVRISNAAGTNSEAAMVRRKAVVIEDSDLLILEAYFTATAGSGTDHIHILGFTDQAANAILASNALAVSSNQDFLGLRWNTDAGDGGEIDLVVIEDGTATVLVDNVFGEDIDRGTAMKLGLRIEKVDADKCRIICAKDGVIRTSQIQTVLYATYDNMFAAALRPCLAAGAAGNTTAPIADVDWIFTRDVRKT